MPYFASFRRAVAARAGGTIGATATAAAIACATVAGCSTTSSPEVGASAAPIDQLAALALAGSKASYIAEYTLTSTNPAITGTAKVYRMPGYLRLDLHAGGQSKQVYVVKGSTYACTGEGKAAACVTLATGEQQIPPAKDPGLQHVFTDELSLLATGTGLSVSGAGNDTASDVSAQCFAVTAVPTGSSLAQGTFCFTPKGVPASAVFADGKMTLDGVTGTPTVSDFAFPAPPTP